MKTIGIKILLVGILLVSYVMHAKSQAGVIEQGDPLFAKLQEAKVPEVVKRNQANNYSNAKSVTWHGYPKFVDNADWYGYDPFFFTDEYPEYYIADFSEKDINHNVIYDKNGNKIATHIVLKTALPKAISIALNSGEYRNWNIAGKEEIFRDSDKSKKVYKVIINNGNNKHALFFQQNGKLLKDKKIIVSKE